MFSARRVTQKPAHGRLGRSRELSLILLISAALCLVFFLVFGDSGYFELRRKEREVRQMEMERDSQLERNRQLVMEIERLKNDLGRIEELARQELKLTKQGEIVIQLQDPKAKPSLRK